MRGRRGDRGVSTLEFAGFLPVLLLVGLAAIQLGLIGYSASQAGSAARAAARVTAQGGPGEAAGLAAMDSGLDATVTTSEGPELSRATVTVNVPLLVPFLGSGMEVRREVTMPTDE
ncbi:TadE/TadG family type IV pilus assembly protein [Streptomyces uncialis]|uniref:TadE/TadG family type IV pilus assembly protein n=1 Tax=Streptomyces uncialis TaxID=1048205 RepID=UPI002E3822C4|nr:TadE/TadG family type IV pilus assembly protein [Streptomyces uncialis]WTE12958.1 pilus assembly protein [Streptomyces uncialis]